ncbi:MAG: TonB-dependent receptor, partial [Bacteroidota bacterium]
MKKIVAIILLLCLFGINNAQNTNCQASLEGAVLDEHDHSPLAFATLYVVELKIGIVSDSLGRFKFENLCEGQYRVKISHLDCEAIVKTIYVSGSMQQNFYPEHHAHALQSVNVLTLKNEVNFTQTKSDLSIEKLNQSKGQTLGEALKNISGVTSLNTGNSVSKPVIHGMHSNRILILNNGIRQEGQQWGAEHAPEIDPFIASSISVVKGANSVRYGSDAIAGVVLIDTKKLRDSTGVNGELNLIGMSNGKAGSASAFLEGNFEKLKALSWRIQGTLKQSGSIWSPNYILANTGMKEQNFSYALAWKKTNYGIDLFYSQFNTTLGIFSASHIGNLSDLQTAFTASVPSITGNFSYLINRPYQHIEHELFKIKTFIRTGDLGKLSFVYARQYNLRYEYDKYRPLNSVIAALNKPELQFEITSHSADIIWEHNRIRQLNGSIGISGLSQANTYEGRFLVPNFKNYTAGIFWIERWKKNKFELEGGLRYDYKHLQVFKYVDENNINSGIIQPIH